MSVTFTRNILLSADSYKMSHFRQYPPGTEYVYSYIESRGGEWPQGVFFGLQMYIKKFLTTPISQADIDEIADFAPRHGVPCNVEGFQYILDKHDGFLPLQIKAIPEGTIVPVRNALVQVVNTDPKCWWLTSFMETALLRAVWYPTTVCTGSFETKKVIHRWLDKTADDLSLLGFLLHDFGARGVSSMESAEIGGIAHLVNFIGSDTMEAVWAAEKYYGTEAGMAAFSLPASEHSTITSWGEDNEIGAFRNMLEEFGAPGGLVACVSDSFNIWNAIDMWKELEPLILEKGCKLIIRPDSGDPVETPVNVVKKCIEVFGSTMNTKGYKVLPAHIGVIQGDGVSTHNINEILFRLAEAGISSANLAFGQGGALLQEHSRDRMKFAMKCSATTRGGETFDVYKDPITDRGKQSKRGVLAVVFDGEELKTIREEDLPAEGEDLLRTVFYNGTLMVDESLDVIRQRAMVPQSA